MSTLIGVEVESDVAKTKARKFTKTQVATYNNNKQQLTHSYNKNKLAGKIVQLNSRKQQQLSQ